MARRPRSKLVPLADVVARFISKQDESPKRAREALSLKVFAAFMQIGPPITDHAEPAYYRSGVLTLTVSSSPWMTELSLLAPQLLKRINKRLGRDVVKELRVRQGNVKRAAPEPPPEHPLTAKQEEDLATWAAEIEDETVRQAMIRAARRSLVRGDSGHEVPSGPPGPRPRPPEPEPQTEPPPESRYGYGFHPGRDRWKNRKK